MLGLHTLRPTVTEAQVASAAPLNAQINGRSRLPMQRRRLLPYSKRDVAALILPGRAGTKDRKVEE